MRRARSAEPAQIKKVENDKMDKKKKGKNARKKSKKKNNNKNKNKKNNKNKKGKNERKKGKKKKNNKNKNEKNNKNNRRSGKSSDLLPDSVYNQLWCFDLAMEQVSVSNLPIWKWETSEYD